MERIKKRRKEFGQEEKMEMVRLHYLEGLNQSELSRMYGTAQSAVSRIICKFASENDKSALFMKNKPVDNQAEEIKALRKEDMELSRKLYDETMRADFLFLCTKKGNLI